MFDAAHIEETLKLRGSDTFGVYIGYQRIGSCNAATKIGRTINVKALQRGRTQGGAEWWFHAFWQLDSRELTYSIEKLIKKDLSSYSMKGSQGQKELFSLTPEQATTELTKLLGAPTVL